MSTMPSLTSQKTTDNGTGIDESTKVAAAAAASRQGTVFHTLVASHENHHLLQLNKESRYSNQLSFTQGHLISPM